MSEGSTPESSDSDLSKMTASQIKLRRGTRFFFESKAPQEPVAADGAAVPAIPPPAVPDGSPGPTQLISPETAEPLPPIDDAAPTKLINPASLKTQQLSTAEGGTTLDEARPTVMKSGKTIERLPGHKTSGLIKRVNSVQPTQPASPAGAPSEEELVKDHDRDLIFGHLKNRPPSGTQPAVPGSELHKSAKPGSGSHRVGAKPGSGVVMKGAMGPVPSSGRRRAAEVPATPAAPAAAGSSGVKPPAGTHFSVGGVTESGMIFGDYKLLKELTIGGFGEVWIALDETTNKEVVLKRLKTEQAEFKRAFYQFDIEIEIGQRVKHPNLVPVLNHGILDGRRFFTMPRITGPSLARILQKRAGNDWALSENEMIAALEMVGRALGFLHRAGVVHCDLKPDNILFSARNKPMLIDLGIARTLKWEQTGYRALKGFREDNSILGTPEYMAPEMFLGENEVIGFGADLYAMGVIMYEILTRQTPFKREPQKAGGDGTRALVDLMDRVQKDAPPELIERNPNAHPVLAELTMQCLSKDPASRPKSADDFAAVIGRVLRPSNIPGPQSKPSALGRLGKLIGKSAKTGKPDKPKP